MALSESSGVQVGGIAYGSKGHRKIVRPKQGPAPRVRPGKGTVNLFVRPKGKR